MKNFGFMINMEKEDEERLFCVLSLNSGGSLSKSKHTDETLTF